MANPTPDISSILQLLQDSAQQRPANATPPVAAQPGHGVPPPSLPQAPYGAPPAHNPYSPQVAPPAYQPPPPAAYSYPQPTSSGNIDLSAIRPDSTGALSIQEAIERARASATQAGFTPYDRQSAGYGGDRGSDSRGYQQQRSRSRSPRGRDGYRESNPYRDERRDYGGPSRDYGRERSFSPRRQGFSPRGHHGGGGGGRNRDRSPLRGNGDNVETMQVEKSLVGLIIGRNGENLRRVESESGCRVQFINADNEAEPYRVCRITGPRDRRDEAKGMINRIIADSGMRGGPPGGGGHPGGDRGGREASRPDRSAAPIPKDGEDTLVIMVPDRTVGLIIGRGGETIRDLQERSGCHINIVSENKSVNGLRPVNLIGTPGATKHAKELILEIVDSDSRNTGTGGGGNTRPPRNDGGYGGGGQDKVNDSIFVPSDAVGMIIGKGGETIREMQNTTGCKINVSQSSGPGETQREIGLVGSRDSIERAKTAILDKVEAAQNKSGGGGGGRGGHRDGGGGGRGHHRDYDNPNYGQSSNHNSAPQSMPASGAAPTTGAGGDADPYAAYGGYDAYVALWWQSQYGAHLGSQAGAPQPPGANSS